MAQHLINILWQALAVNVQMLESIIKTMNLSSKGNSLKLPTNCDTWINYFLLSLVKALQKIKKCVSSSILSLSHTSHSLCSIGNLSYLAVSILKGAMQHLNMEKHYEI